MNQLRKLRMDNKKLVKIVIAHSLSHSILTQNLDNICVTNAKRQFQSRLTY